MRAPWHIPLVVGLLLIGLAIPVYAGGYKDCRRDPTGPYCPTTTTTEETTTTTIEDTTTTTVPDSTTTSLDEESTTTTFVDSTTSTEGTTTTMGITTTTDPDEPPGLPDTGVDGSLVPLGTILMLLGVSVVGLAKRYFE